MNFKKWLSPVAFSVVTLASLSFQNCSSQFQVEQSQVDGVLDSNNLLVPVITFNSTPLIISSSSHNITFRVDLEPALIRSLTCQVNVLASFDCSNYTIALSNLIDGDHPIRVIAVTTSGVTSENSIVIRKDSSAPTLNVSMSPPAQTALASAQFVFSASDTLSGIERIECSLDQANFSPCMSPHSLTSLASGNHNMRIRVSDRAENLSSIYSYSWLIDSSVPTVVIASGPQIATNSSSASFVFSGVGVQTFQCQLDSGAYVNCSSPHIISNVAVNMAHVFRVRGTSATGVVGSPSVYNWTHDSIAPIAPAMISAVPNITNQRNNSVSFTSQDTGTGISRFECLNSGQYAACTSPISFSNVVDGSYAVQVRAVDQAGNISSTSSINWTVDTAGPSLAFSQTPSSTTSAVNMTFSFTATDSRTAVASLRCSVNMANFMDCASPYITAQLMPGNHNFRVQAIDQAGNMTQISHVWTQNVVTTPESRFAEARAVLTRNCTGCHLPGASIGSLAFNTELEYINAGLVSPGSLSGSKLIYRLRNYPQPTEGRTMPPSGPLSAADYSALESWVMNIPASTVPSNFFACAPDEAPSTLDAKRLSKTEVLNTLRLVLSRALGDTETSQILLSNPNFFTNRIPNDSKAPYSKGDDNFSALHARTYFDLASELSDLLIQSTRYSRFVSTYVNYNRGSCVLTDVNNLSAACRDVFIQNFLLRLWGRPVEINNNNLNNELAAFQQEFILASSSTAAVGNVIFKALVSPQFLFHVFSDVTLQSSNINQLSSYAIARRLSYQYMRSGLDEGLLAIAQSQNLNTDAGFQSALNYVSTRNQPMVSEFTDEWLKLSSMPIQTNATHPKFVTVSQGINVNDTLRQAMQQEIVDLVSYINSQSRPVREILTSNISFARNPDLMRIYGQTTVAPVSVTEQTAVRFPASQRSGLLTRAGYLFGGSHTERPIMRGVHIQEQFLCRTVSGSAPPDATQTQLPTNENLTTREKYQQITSGASCIGCHSQINPIGFAFSHYNTLGAFQSSEPVFNSNNVFVQYLPTNSIVNLQVAMGLDVVSNSAVEYSQIVADSRDFKRCMSQHYFSYSNGLRSKTNLQNSCSMQRMYQTIESNGTLNEFFRAPAEHPSFKLRTLVR